MCVHTYLYIQIYATVAVMPTPATSQDISFQQAQHSYHCINSNLCVTLIFANADQVLVEELARCKHAVPMDSSVSHILGKRLLAYFSVLAMAFGSAGDM